MRTTIDRAMLTEGADVYDSEGQHVGTINEVGQDHVLVQKGTFFPRDVYVPITAIERSEEGSIWINVAKDDIDSHGWDGPPAALDRDADRDSARIAVHEEELEARKTTRQAGEVTVRKDVVEEHRTIDVPVAREEVRVTRNPVDRPATAAEADFAEGGGTVRIPVMEEDVEVSKLPRVKEEIEIDKVVRQDTKRVGGTVRREEVDVDADENLR
jgi:uncharacterized protein (TIGR02271 family)